VDKGQTSFIKGRYILDGVVILHDWIMDAGKIYFLEEVLQMKGF
jgi:hypothetical protein